MKQYTPKTKNTVKIEYSKSYCPKYSLTRNKLESGWIFETSDYLSTIHAKKIICFWCVEEKYQGDASFQYAPKA